MSSIGKAATSRACCSTACIPRSPDVRFAPPSSTPSSPTPNVTRGSGSRPARSSRSSHSPRREPCARHAASGSTPTARSPKRRGTVTIGGIPTSSRSRPSHPVRNSSSRPGTAATGRSHRRARARGTWLSTSPPCTRWSGHSSSRALRPAICSTSTSSRSSRRRSAGRVSGPAAAA